MSDYTKIMRDAAEHGAGRNGLTIPVTSKTGHRGLVTLTTDAPLHEWQAWWRSRIAELVEIAHRFHRKALGVVVDSETPSLPPRGVECLAWASRGKTMSETGIILGLAENTVRAYLRTARERLCVSNTTDAVRKAIELGILKSNASR